MTKQSQAFMDRVQQLKPWQNLYWLEKLYPCIRHKEYYLRYDARKRQFHIKTCGDLIWNSARKGTYERTRHRPIGYNYAR